jgi:transcriptional repressor NrdR
MRCPACTSEDLRVLETRDLDDAIRRRRECTTCGHRFTTLERSEALPCPRCGAAETRVIGWGGEPRSLRRHRECSHCGHRFSTTERIDALTTLVVKRDGRREPYDRNKVLRGLRIACEKRPVPLEEIERLADTVERELARAGQAEIPSTRVGDLVIQHLVALDPIAYIRFASVYREMKNLEAIRREVDRLLAEEETEHSARVPAT